MLVIPVNPDDPAPDPVDRAVEVVRAGGVVALPTETFYGLAADAFAPAALVAVNRLKGKPDDAPLLLLASGPDQVSVVAERLPSRFEELAARFWPGPLTLVLPAARGVPPEVSGGRGTVALRVPGLALPRAVAARHGRPITGVSANRHGRPPCSTAGQVRDTFAAELGAVLDGGPAPGGHPSTIVDLCGPRPRLLRRGRIPDAVLRRCLPDLEPET